MPTIMAGEFLAAVGSEADPPPLQRTAAFGVYSEAHERLIWARSRHAPLPVVCGFGTRALSELPSCLSRIGRVLVSVPMGVRPRLKSAPAQGCPELISPSVLVAVLQTLFAALLSFASLGQPSLTEGSRQGHFAREPKAITLTLIERGTGAKEEGDRSDPHRSSGGDALPPIALSQVGTPAPSRLSPVSLAPLRLVERSARAHPATGPPLA
jgi:hypothetical protein